MDGAKPWPIFRLIKFPLLLVSVAPLLISSFAFNFNNFNLIYMLTNGGPRDPACRHQRRRHRHPDLAWSTRWRSSAPDRDYGLASAFSILIFIIVAVDLASSASDRPRPSRI